MKRASFMCCLVAAIGGCHAGGSLSDLNENHSISASEFQQSCAVDSDCVAVYQGTLTCCGGSCPNAAVNQVGYSAYASAVASRTPMCNPEPPCAALSCLAGAICSNGTCQFSPAGTTGVGLRCPSGCPATSTGATVVVTTVPAMVVQGVQATLTGPEDGTMSCTPSVDAIVCDWPAGVPVTAGTYALEVSAPGYQTTTVEVQVTVPPPNCGCTIASIQPSTVTLSPVDGG